jgi:hypothetical protein
LAAEFETLADELALGRVSLGLAAGTAQAQAGYPYARRSSVGERNFSASESTSETSEIMPEIVAESAFGRVSLGFAAVTLGTRTMLGRANAGNPYA